MARLSFFDIGADITGQSPSSILPVRHVGVSIFRPAPSHRANREQDADTLAGEAFEWLGPRHRAGLRLVDGGAE